MNKPSPISAAGWISMPVTWRAAWDSARARKEARCRHSQWLARWAHTAWTPGYSSATSQVLRAAGSRSTAQFRSRPTRPSHAGRLPRPTGSVGQAGEQDGAQVPLPERRDDRQDEFVGVARALGNLDRGPQRGPG